MRSSRHFTWLLACLGGVYLCGAALVARAQQAPYTLHVEHDEVLIDLLAADHATLKPDPSLTADDVFVRSDGKRVPLVSFTSSAGPALRPLSVWLIAQCDLLGWQQAGSAFAEGQTAALVPALSYLEAGDTVAAGGWCDDGESLVTPPGTDAAAAVAGLDSWMHRRDAPKHTDSRRGELALQQMLRNIAVRTAAMRPRPLPVIIFLNQDDTGAPSREYVGVRSILLEQSSMAYVLTDGRGTFHPSDAYRVNNTPFILRNLAEDTGGETFQVGPFTRYPDALGRAVSGILQGLHHRYQLSFVPPVNDGREHLVTVQLSQRGTALHAGDILRARTGYLAPKSR